jgi:hypothetical protein
MTYRNLISLRSVLTALALALFVCAPFAAVLAQHSIDSVRGDESLSVRAYFDRANYDWPYAVGPAYGVEDITAEGVLSTPAGFFQMRKSLDIPDELRNAVDLRGNTSRYFVIQFDSAGVLGVEPYHPAFKLHQNIGRAPLADADRAVSDIYTLDVFLFPGEDTAAAASAICASRGSPRSKRSGLSSCCCRISCRPRRCRRQC